MLLFVAKYKNKFYYNYFYYYSVTKMTNQVRPARLEDTKSIVLIGNMHDFRKKGSHEATKEGFLVHLLSEEEAGRMLQNSQEYLRVYESQRGIEGYIAAYDRESWLVRDQKINKTISLVPESPIILNQPYVYLRHIAVRNDAPCGVATTIENEFLKEMAERGYDRAIGEISLNPLNKRSFNYHLAKGFSLIGVNYDPDLKITWGVVCKELKIK